MGSDMTDSELIEAIHSHKVPLPPEYVDIHMKDGLVIAALFEYPKGCIHWDTFKLSDLPNNLIGRSDLERFGIVSLVK
jgi:hypothetical protein